MNHIYDSRLLIVDDNAELCRMLVDMLSREGFSRIGTAGTCAQAMDFFKKGGQTPGASNAKPGPASSEPAPPDLVILDINLPDGDGFSLMQRIRMVSQAPVLFLSARDEDNDRLLGLGLGADDYMTKPFLPRELALRITAILRRTYFPPMQEMHRPQTLKLGKRTVDLDAGMVTDGQESTALTAKELGLLKKLYENRGNIVTFDALCTAVWGDDYYGYENTLMVHIRRLREKIEENPSAPRWLLTVRGLGYRLAKEG